MEFCYGLLRDLIKSQKQHKQQSSTVLTRRKSWKNILSFSHSNNNLKWNIQQYCCHQWWRACHDDNDDGYNDDCLYICVCEYGEGDQNDEHLELEFEHDTMLMMMMLFLLLMLLMMIMMIEIKIERLGTLRFKLTFDDGGVFLRAAQRIQRWGGLRQRQRQVC